MAPPRGGKMNQPCFNMQKTGKCRFGARCHFSHDISFRQDDERSPHPSRKKAEETPEQQQAKAHYNSWKRHIKNRPKPNDTRTMELLWEGALIILNGKDRDWKQMLPRDLDDQENYGREHMHVALSIVAGPHGHSEFINLAQPFLSVLTHSALLDCLSVDTSVGGLYNYMSGTNGSRAIPFFQRLCNSVVEGFLEASHSISAILLETTLVAMVVALRELLRREQRASFHDDLPELINSIESIPEAVGIDPLSATSQKIRNTTEELRGIVARTNGLLQDQGEQPVGGVSTSVVASTYPRQLIQPQGRHDNDNMDITNIKILPTEGEIRSDHPVFLPSTDLDQPHFLTDRVQRHLDTHFRLYRHDCFSEVIDALGRALIATENDPTILEDSKFSLGDIRAYTYPKANLRYISFDHRRGLEAQISFLQPQVIRKKSSAERQKWWGDSKRLEEGILLCLLSLDDAKVSPLFFTVSEKSIATSNDYGLTSDKNQATITAKLATHLETDLELMTRLSCQKQRGILLEFPGVLLTTFIPILENLQSMQRLSRLPFRQWILPGQGTTLFDIPPPLYARGQNFAFSLKCIMKDSEDDYSLKSTASTNSSIAVDVLEARTHLDRGQCEALIAALTREFAFIQGPPGTGKSYLGVQLMRVLQSCKAKARLGPVVVVCYTNHALDQFLEHLIAVGIERVIRIGGQSRSTLLEGKNLRVVSQDELKTRSEGYQLAMSHKALEVQEKIIKKLLASIHSSQKRREWASMKNHLQSRYPAVYRAFSRIDEDGFKKVGQEPFDAWASGKFQALPKDTDSSQWPIDQVLLQAMGDVHSVSLPNRHRLVAFWAEEMVGELTNDLFESVKASYMQQEQLRMVRDDIDRRVLQTADVIGVTTTGLARRIATLQHVHCKVVICEEAGEVLEPHIISALLPKVEHFIQIGDHQQLRPQINNYNLSLESNQGASYQLDRSQFERLSVGEKGMRPFPVAQLNVQRRMRPGIATLIRNTIYPRLVDHDSTKALPDVVGMRKNIYWLDHENIEEGSQGDVHQKSHSNLWEVDMVHALVRHIVRQGTYNSTDIAVLTPYTGQLQKLRTKMRNDFEIILSDRDQETLAKDGFDASDDDAESNKQHSEVASGAKPLQKKMMSELLRVATVDNFQGEEAKVVIISLVRSNKARKIGFLKTDNRINVLLSRAQHGMYLIGNADTYSSQRMWGDILGMLRETDSVGKAFALCCPRHPTTAIEVSQPEDFARLSPEGGCQLACDRRLNDCGHKCKARCHSEAMHLVFSCPQPCQRLHEPCNHNCQKQTCGEDCGLCMVRMDDVQLPCGHFKSNVPCYQTLNLSSITCVTSVQKMVSKCKHIIEVQCCLDVTSERFVCSYPCGVGFDCGHPCPGSCGRCNLLDGDNQNLIKHVQCSKICGRRFGTCNHTCRRSCHVGQPCGLCGSKCEVRCAHSRCTLKCYEACAPCVEDCTWSCEHQGNCEMPCAAPCNRLPCDKRCTSDLSCGHQCPGLCGEICPEDYCQECSGRKEARVDLLEMKTFSEIDVNETPIVVLGCGHFFTAETLDGHMGMAEVYTQDAYGVYTGLQDVSAMLAGPVPRCPDCQCPVRQYGTNRFNRVINRAVIDEMSKRFLTSGKNDLQRLGGEILELDRYLDNSRNDVLHSIRQASAHMTGRATLAKELEVNKILNERYNLARKVEKDIKACGRKVADKNQPVQKLHEATLTASRRKSMEKLITDLSFGDTIPAIPRDRRVTLGGHAMQIHAECIILTDSLSTALALQSEPAGSSFSVPGGPPENTAKPFFTTCRTFIDECDIENLPKLGVEARLYFARMARSYESYCRSTNTNVNQASTYVKDAKALLEDAEELCKRPFENAEGLRRAVQESVKLLGREWYEEVTAEELAAVKAAMVRGPQGINTHSGHWYNCANGHPFAIGECGMPMELARCPECGAPVGGQSHQAVEGVTRATDMEN